MPRDAWVRRVRRALLAWYAANRRDLPWRRSRDPYAVWVSEVMLQQTQVQTVVPFFERWMQRFPDVGALAAARPDAVLQSWEGLGYYSRARALQRAARVVVSRHEGRLPRDAGQLRELPGIGPYTAGAIASIAFGLAEPVVDGNVARVLCRLHALRGDPTRTPLRPRLWELARSLLPPERPADFNQALMELGAAVCRPRAPACARCPLRRWCAARERGLVERLPQAPQRPAVARVSEVAALARRNGRWLLIQRPLDAPRWAGMWQFPTAELGRRETPGRAARRALRSAAGLDSDHPVSVLQLTYSVTRYRVDLEALRCTSVRGRARPRTGPAVRWCRPAELDRFAMPAVHRRIASRLDGRDRPARSGRSSRRPS